MTLGTDLEGKGEEISRTGRSIRKGTVVPSDESVGFEEGRKLSAVVAALEGLLRTAVGSAVMHRSNRWWAV